MKNILEIMVDVCNQRNCMQCLESGSNKCNWCENQDEFNADYGLVYSESMRRLKENTKND